MYGKKYIGVIRTTYIIDPDGNIAWVDPKVSVEGHIAKVIQVLETLQSQK
jgi:peroxiredoxin Q/BCP